MNCSSKYLWISLIAIVALVAVFGCKKCKNRCAREV